MKYIIEGYSSTKGITGQTDRDSIQAARNLARITSETHGTAYIKENGVTIEQYTNGVREVSRCWSATATQKLVEIANDNDFDMAAMEWFRKTVTRMANNLPTDRSIFMADVVAVAVEYGYIV